MDLTKLPPGKLDAFESMRTVDALYPNSSFTAALAQHLAMRGGVSLADDTPTPFVTPFSGLVDDSTCVRAWQLVFYKVC